MGLCTKWHQLLLTKADHLRSKAKKTDEKFSAIYSKLRVYSAVQYCSAVETETCQNENVNKHVDIK